MALRRATLSDAAAIKAIFDAFNTQSGERFRARPVARYRDQIAQTEMRFAIETAAPARYAAVERRANEQRYHVHSLYPRGATVAQLKPVLQRALLDQFAAHPTEGGWTVIGRFFMGVNAAGQPDGGEFNCREWQSIAFLGATIGQDADGWYIMWTLTEAANV